MTNNISTKALTDGFQHPSAVAITVPIPIIELNAFLHSDMVTKYTTVKYAYQYLYSTGLLQKLTGFPEALVENTFSDETWQMPMSTPTEWTPRPATGRSD